jgi:tetratricopeptide (TPR) repeat protein
MRRLVLCAALAVALLAIAGVVARPERTSAPAGRPGPDPSAVRAQQPGPDPLTVRVARAQQHLRDLPGDWAGWAALGGAYLEQARVTADPALYPQAEQAARKSLTLRSAADNGDALVVLGALANARHDFAGARKQATAALRVDSYDSDAYGVLADALTQLGDAPGATGAVQKMLDLRPGLAAYARASYDLELRGRIDQATSLMRRALDDAVDPHDVAFCQAQLGDLAFGRGDLRVAGESYAAALSTDSSSVAALRGRARVRAASGDMAGALADYADLTARLPGPSYLLEYASLLALAGRSGEAAAQIELATAAQHLFAANGGSDALASAALALAAGKPSSAVEAARAEWAKRQHPDVADTLAWALHADGRDAEALGYARKAVATGGHTAGYAYHLAMIELALGDEASARTEFLHALTTNPYFSPVDGPTARRALAALGGSR